MLPFVKLLVASSFAATAPLAASSVVTPSWDAELPHSHVACVNDERWVFVSLPNGPAPASGWPVWFSFVTDTFPNKDAPSATCGVPSTHRIRKNYSAFATPRQTLISCYNASNATHGGRGERGNRLAFPPPHHHSSGCM